MAGFDEILDSNSRLMITPINPEDRKDLQAIDRKTKEDIRLRHHFFIDQDWVCNTVSFIYVSNMIKVLYGHIVHNGVEVLAHTGSSLNLYDLFEVSASHKKNEKAEKVGNINVSFVPGKDVINIISNYEETNNEYVNISEAYVYPDDEELTGAILKIDELTRRQAKDKYDIILSHKWYATGITYVFVENIYRYMIEKITKLERNSVMINFNDLIELHAIRKKEGFDIKLRPGYGAKLFIKSDESTEADDGDEY